MKTNATISLLAVAKTVRKQTPPPTRVFKDKRAKSSRKAWRREEW